METLEKKQNKLKRIFYTIKKKLFSTLIANWKVIVILRFGQ